METRENQINKKILALTSLIKERYPELYIHLEEFNETMTTSEHPDVNIKALEDYYESLKSMAEKYIEEKDKKELSILNNF
ncbi:MAG: hypothetical protein M3Q58_14515 [Bacteroidota bacterium]|nr:hypothetical protein [Bacteroidota bacterium]